MRKKSKRLSQFCVFSAAGMTFLLIVFIPNTIRFQQEDEKTDRFVESLKGPLAYDDPMLVRYINSKVLVSPSTEPYVLANKKGNSYTNHRSERFYHNFFRSTFNGTEKGFFVEAGALDGETMSNTLWLEQEKGWTGLLVEPDPSNFNRLLTKRRKAWSANACLSIEKYPIMETLSSVDVLSDVKVRSMGSIIRDTLKIKGLTSDHVYNSYYKSQCYPLGSLLLALNVTRIDMLSLDVEFVEEKILRNFDFEKFDVQVMLIEFYDSPNKIKFHEYLLSKGFEFVADFGADMIYCKKDTDVARKLQVLYPKRFFSVVVEKKPT